MPVVMVTSILYLFT